MEYFLKSTFNGVCIALTNGANAIGRSRVTKVKNLRCSKKQVELVIDDNSECVRVVATGGNRCCVAGKPLSCGQQASLKPGDWLELLEGEYRFLLERRPSLSHTLPSSSACLSPCSSSSRSLRQLVGSKRVQSADISISGDSPSKKRCTAVELGSTPCTAVDEEVWTSLDGDSMYLMMTPGVKPSAKIAGFDMDHTLITTKSGKVFPRDLDDWRLMFTETAGKLKKLVKDGYKIVIFTNQMGLSRGKLSPVDLHRKLSAVASRLGVPVQCLVASRDGKHRKPMLGMWQYLTEQGNGGVAVDIAESFYCGDAACRELAWAPGRKKDFSGSDRLFALNIGVPFFTPEEYFLGYPRCRKYQLPEFDPRKAVADAKLLSQPGVARSGREVAVLVGAPGSGKSHIAQRHLAAAGYRVANRDSLKSWQKCVQLVDDSLKAGCNVVVDNTNSDVESRKRYIDVARRHGVQARCIVMQTSLAQSRHNNKFRELVDPSHQRVSEMVFNVYKTRYQEPSLSEGFSEITKMQCVPQFSDPKLERIYSMYLLDK